MDGNPANSVQFIGNEGGTLLIELAFEANGFMCHLLYCLTCHGF